MTPALPPTLPSPRPLHSHAASRSKRKLEDDVATDEPHSKKPRTTPTTSQTASSRPPVPPFPHSRSGTQAPASAATTQSDASEDGEVREGLPIYRNSIAVVSNVPVRRPRRRIVSTEYWGQMYTKYQAEGVRLKYSAKARIDSTYPSTDSRFRALSNPPPAGTAYHKFGHLMARLEYLDALLCFTYALWCIDMANTACYRQNWPLVLKLVEQVKAQWRNDDGEDWERAFHGVMYVSMLNTLHLITDIGIDAWSRHSSMAASGDLISKSQLGRATASCGYCRSTRMQKTRKFGIRGRSGRRKRRRQRS